MKAEFTAIIEPAPEGGYWAICPEVPGANGQGETIEETKDSLRQAIELIFEYRIEDILRGLPADAIRETVSIRWNATISCGNWDLQAVTSNAKDLRIPSG
jgi:predicted RNase H-like HicB family nuclease